jgi:SpoVK/Ycf46/Vps4 family AAA+-type ATPase
LIPGTGKTTIAKATANEFGFPLFQLDLGALFGKFVGDTEENFRRVIETVDGIGRCVLFIDEIEKSLNRSATSGEGDTGTSSRAFATLLSWLSEHKSPVFVIATTNDHTKLPTELIRKGRFDDLFWLDVPKVAERERIFEVLIKRYNRDATKYKLKQLAEKTEGFTGAEIEEIIKGAMFARFDKDGQEFTNIDLIDEINATKPLTETSAAEIKEMRNKAINKLRVASLSGASQMFTGAGQTSTTRTDTGDLRELGISE